MSAASPLQIVWSDRAALERAVGHLAAGGLLLEGAPKLALFQPVTLKVRVASNPSWLVQATPVNVAPGGGYFLQVEPTHASGLQQAVRQALSALAPEPQPSPAPARAAARVAPDSQPSRGRAVASEGSGARATEVDHRPDDADTGDALDELEFEVDLSELEDAFDEGPAAPADDGSERATGDTGLSPAGVGAEGEARETFRVTPKKAWELLDPQSDVPLSKQVASLSIPERIRLARHANRPARRLLVHDVEKRIHLEVCKNPQVKVEELIEYAGMGSLSAQALRWMAKQGRLVRRRDMVIALVTNPSTPQDSAMMLMDRMTHSELLRVVRSPKPRERIKQEARRKLMKAGVM